MINYLHYQTEKRFKKMLQNSWIRNLYNRDRVVNEGIWHQLRRQTETKTEFTKQDIEKLYKTLMGHGKKED